MLKQMLTLMRGDLITIGVIITQIATVGWVVIYVIWSFGTFCFHHTRGMVVVGMEDGTLGTMVVGTHQLRLELLLGPELLLDIKMLIQPSQHHRIMFEVVELKIGLRHPKRFSR